MALSSEEMSGPPDLCGRDPRQLRRYLERLEARGLCARDERGALYSPLLKMGSGNTMRFER
jgi:hypothetical protein